MTEETVMKEMEVNALQRKGDTQTAASTPIQISKICGKRKSDYETDNSLPDFL